MTQLWTSLDFRLRLAALALIAAIILPVAWYLGSPLFINQTVNERFPSDGQGQAAAAASLLRSGQFTVVDTLHKGAGTATLFELPDGKRLLRFERFKVQNGPDLYVYLSGHTIPRDSTQLHEGAAFEVGRLKGNIGDQNYELPGDLDLSQFKSVVIYCKRFSVVFSSAELIAQQ